MKLSDLSAEVIKKIKTVNYDSISEKHEGPWGWDGVFRYGNPEFMMMQDWPVLLPIGQEQHSNITVLRVLESKDGKTLTLFLKDTTFTNDPEWEMFDAGRLAI